MEITIHPTICEVHSLAEKLLSESNIKEPSSVDKSNFLREARKQLTYTKEVDPSKRTY